jgi:hypothetical protein
VALCGRSPDIKDPFIVEPKKEDPNKAEEHRASKSCDVWGESPQNDLRNGSK